MSADLVKIGVFLIAMSAWSVLGDLAWQRIGPSAKWPEFFGGLGILAVYVGWLYA